MTSRRQFLTGLLATGLTTSLPLTATQAHAQQYASSLRATLAQIHVRQTIDQMIHLISNQQGTSLQNGLANMLSTKADMTAVAKAVLQDKAIGLNAAQLSLFSTSFTLYLARKYAPAFTMMRGGTMTITNVTEYDGYYAIDAIGIAWDGTRTDTKWMVVFKNGIPKIHNFFWRGVSMVRLERNTISSLYSQANGNINTVSRMLFP